MMKKFYFIVFITANLLIQAQNKSPKNIDLPWEINLSGGPQFNFLQSGLLDKKFISGLNTDFNLSKRLSKKIALRLGLGYSKFNFKDYLNNTTTSIQSIDSTANTFFGDHNQYKGILGIDYIVNIGKSELRFGIGAGMQFLDYQRNKLSYRDPLQGGNEVNILENSSAKSISPFIENNISYRYKLSNKIGLSAGVKTNWLPENSIPSNYKKVYQDDVMDYQAICKTSFVEGYQYIPFSISPTIGFNFNFGNPRPIDKPIKQKPTNNNETSEKTIQQFRIDSLTCLRNIGSQNYSFNIHYRNPEPVSSTFDNGVNSISITIQCLNGLNEFSTSTIIPRGNHIIPINTTNDLANCNTGEHIVSISWTTISGNHQVFIDTIKLCNTTCNIDLLMNGQGPETTIIDSDSESIKCFTNYPSSLSILNNSSSPLLRYKYDIIADNNGINSTFIGSFQNFIPSLGSGLTSSTIPIERPTPYLTLGNYSINVTVVNSDGDTCKKSHEFYLCDTTPQNTNCNLQASVRFRSNDTCRDTVLTIWVSNAPNGTSLYSYTIINNNTGSISSINRAENFYTTTIPRSSLRNYCFIVSALNNTSQVLCSDTVCIKKECDSSSQSCRIDVSVSMQNISISDTCKKRVTFVINPWSLSDRSNFRIYDANTFALIHSSGTLTTNNFIRILNTGNYFVIATRIMSNGTRCIDTFFFKICPPRPCIAPCQYSINGIFIRQGTDSIRINNGDTISKYCNGENFKVYARGSSNIVRASFNNNLASARPLIPSNRISGELQEPSSNGSVSKIIDTIYIFDSCGNLCNRHIYYFYIKCECCNKFNQAKTTESISPNSGNYILIPEVSFVNPENIPFIRYEVSLTSIHISGEIVNSIPLSFLLASGLTNENNLSCLTGIWANNANPIWNQLESSTFLSSDNCTLNRYKVNSGIFLRNQGNKKYTVNYCLRYRFYVSATEFCERTVCHTQTVKALNVQEVENNTQQDFSKFGISKEEFESKLQKINNNLNELK